MIRLPYSWRRNEGVNNGIPKIRVLHYKLDCLLENIYIRVARIPKCGINKEHREEKVIVSLTSSTDSKRTSYVFPLTLTLYFFIILLLINARYFY